MKTYHLPEAHTYFACADHPANFGSSIERTALVLTTAPIMHYPVGTILCCYPHGFCACCYPGINGRVFDGVNHALCAVRESEIGGSHYFWNIEAMPINDHGQPFIYDTEPLPLLNPGLV